MTEEQENEISNLDIMKHGVDEAKDALQTIQDNIEELVDWIINQQDRIEESEENDSENAFDFLINNGLTLGTRFRFDGKEDIYTITGITRKGFRATAVSKDGEQLRNIIPARTVEELKRNLHRFQIVKNEA